MKKKKEITPGMLPHTISFTINVGSYHISTLFDNSRSINIMTMLSVLHETSLIKTNDRDKIFAQYCWRR